MANVKIKEAIDKICSYKIDGIQQLSQKSIRSNYMDEMII